MTAETAILERYRRGDISPEIALMQLLLALGSLPALCHCLAAPQFASLAQAAFAYRDGLTHAAALVQGGLAEGRDAVAAIREQFDRAVALSPEAAVALYSLGSPDLLGRATDELVARLRQWRLLDRRSVVLDIGCGIGRLETALAPEVAAITGIDVSPNMIAEARRRCAGLPNVTLAGCSGTDLGGFPDAAFDLVLAVDSFPYLVAAGRQIAERHIADAARLLRAGGALAIFNYSYRGDLAADRETVAELTARHALAVERNGTRDFALWDGVTFLLRKPALLRKSA